MQDGKMGNHPKEVKVPQLCEFLQRFARGELNRNHMQLLITASSEDILNMGRAPFQVDLPDRLLNMSVEELISLAESEGLKIPPRSRQILNDPKYANWGDESGTRRLRCMCIRSSFEGATRGTFINADDELKKVLHQFRKFQERYPNGATLPDLLRLWLHARSEVRRTFTGFANGYLLTDEETQSTEFMYPHIVLDEEGNAKLSFYPEENFFPGDVYYVARIEK